MRQKGAATNWQARIALRAVFVGLWLASMTGGSARSQNLEVSPGCDPKVTHVEPPPLQAMVRGPSGPDKILSKIPDGFTHYHYASIFLSEDKIFINYSVSPLDGGGESRWRVFPISWLYERKGE